MLFYDRTLSEDFNEKNQGSFLGYVYGEDFLTYAQFDKEVDT